MVFWISPDLPGNSHRAAAMTEQGLEFMDVGMEKLFVGKQIK